ncbi:UDP-glucose 4-epimerase [Pseudomonas sp. 10B238]|jgi:UDP-glucose 4-epimerase|uniref:UDP-glucose 4-epimerase GalE n=1 Tax=Pseudomonadaceae TaxID=135621 RepID=UPI000617B2A9|nr:MULTISPECIES: UDP-glucose 4-epimerase GalE [Pseudomonadaceae]MAL35261.1 UDP-glucose 4-epimerase GalE [Pseudomonas sp.]MBU0950666.1 UDP-glucose 4-epimerase GalE [Gammaproteobacteria bacterium]KJJ62145.1 UDP-glucose 4-epimerase [Pseudomonas sp. 10B238]MBK3794300.1 UDP-glucose 4-epimerase GalE [Stutzerimonas stutzeri]MBK3875790.1 UDP-glucose 4-epimerase GalE [Stutzerimonas stutzeri]|tara:strand:+ start:1705 stop:2775 length:1071 start_codon:yes stop_codon:yes gene_type:complete
MILVTGGAGYIGSHAVLELLLAGHEVLVLDDLSNSSKVALDRVEHLAGRTLQFIKGDVRNRSLLKALFASYPITAVLHFAGLKAVGESVREPLRYYETNVSGSIALCQAMAEAGVFKLVFSSSATVYGDSPKMPITENCPTGIPTNPYGQSKLMAENVLKGLAESDPRWSIALLRYFNPIGAHESGLIGEDPNGIPNNLLPYMLQVAVGRRKQLNVYGADYPTPDGTGVRDYIHVVDLAKGHLKALERLDLVRGVSTWNLGTGRGYSVRQMITAFEEVIGRPLPYVFKARRPGDAAQCWSDPSKASDDLGWKAERDLLVMLTDAWRWQSRNPQGYGTEKSAAKAPVAANSNTAMAS